MKYTNNSIVIITEIGQTDTYQNNALQCITDRKPCCQPPPNRVGEWYFPDRTLVPTPGLARTYYRLRGYNGTVNLNRLASSDITFPSGQFCCVVPDATNIIQTLCINISKIIVLLWCMLPASSPSGHTLPPTPTHVTCARKSISMPHTRVRSHIVSVVT